MRGCRDGVAERFTSIENPKGSSAVSDWPRGRSVESGDGSFGVSNLLGGFAGFRSFCSADTCSSLRRRASRSAMRLDTSLRVSSK